MTSTEVQQPKPKTQDQKFKAAHALMLRMATVISKADTREFNNKMAQTKKLLQYWESDISVEIIRKDCASNDEEISEDDEMSDDNDYDHTSDDDDHMTNDDHMSGDDDHMSNDHFDNDTNADVSRMVIETEVKWISPLQKG